MHIELALQFASDLRGSLSHVYHGEFEVRAYYSHAQMCHQFFILHNGLSVEVDEPLFNPRDYGQIEEFFKRVHSLCESAFKLERKDKLRPFYEKVVGLIGKCTYKPNWKVQALRDKKGVYLQLEVTDTPCSQTGETTEWKSGKRYLSEFACRQEIIGAAFALIKDAEMHECHEWFRYRGASIYNPHLDPDALAVMASKKESFNTRTDSMERA